MLISEAMISRRISVVCAALALAACASGPVADAPPAPDAAIEFSSPAAELNYHLLLGEIATNRGEHDRATDAYLAAMALTTDAGVAERAVQLALFTQRIDDARRAVARWRALEPDAQGPLEAELVVELRANDAQAAYRIAERLLEIWRAPSDSAFQALGGLLVDEPTMEPSIVLMQRLTERYNVGAAWHVLGLLALRANDLELAQEAAARARVLEPESAQAAMLESRVLVLAGERERGIALMRATAAEHPDDPTVRFALAGLYLATGGYQEAADELAKILDQAPAFSDARWMLAMVLLQLQDADGAEVQLRELLADPVRRWDVPYFLGGVYELRGDWAGALEWFDQVEWGDNLLNARIKAVHMLYQLGRLDDARTRLAYLHDDFPEMASRLYRVEAELLSRAGDRAGALAVFDRALDAQPDDVELLYSRALLQERLGNVDAAIADLRRVRALQPDSPVAKNALGYLLADRGSPTQWDEARRLIGEALEREPQNAAYLDSMGWVLFRLGDLDGARDWLLRSWAAQRDAEVGAHLGEVLWRLGAPDAAREIWLEALRLDAEHPVLIDTLRRLDADLPAGDS